jgi:hypothetical protein
MKKESNNNLKELSAMAYEMQSLAKKYGHLSKMPEYKRILAFVGNVYIKVGNELDCRYNNGVIR